MADLEKDKHVDELLNSLLAGYSDVQPRPGLQTRVLTNLRLNSSKKNSYFWLWAIITAGGLALAVFAIYSSKITSLPEPPRIERAGPPTVVPNPIVGSPHTPRPPHRKSDTQREEPPKVAEVRQEVFPTPLPLSDQERLLLRYLAGTPKEEIAVHAHEDEPAGTTEPARPESQRITGTGMFSTR